MKKSLLVLIISLIFLADLLIVFFVVGPGFQKKGPKAQPTTEEEELPDALSGDDAMEQDLAENTADAMLDGEAQTEEAENAESVEQESAPEIQREPLEKYRPYLDINPYVAGWLTIDGMIDDPVVYTPASQNYFLHRDLDGTDLEKGTFFIAIDWREDCNHTLIYGHNMSNGSGFGSLQKYADPNYGLSHSVVRFDTLYEEKEYELLGVFYSSIQEDELETEEMREEADERIAEESIAQIEEEEGEVVTVEELTVADLDLSWDFGGVDIYRQEKDEDNGRFRYYYYTDLSDQADFDYYVRNVKERALYDTGADAQWGDELLTLSTCSYHVENGRFVVVFVHHK